MKNELCIEWRQIGLQSWNYVIGTRGKSTDELNRLLKGFESRNNKFEFRIRPFAISHNDIAGHYTVSWDAAHI